MNLPEGVIILDSLGDIQPDNTSPILVCASHCGDNGTFARKLNSCHVKAVFLNNAGIGKNQAGISGLPYYEAANILACAVDNFSAGIGVARDTWESGIISHINKIAEKAGICPGDTVQKAVDLISRNFIKTSIIQENIENLQDNRLYISNLESNLHKQTRIQTEGSNITITDSITFLNENNAGEIVVCGSHGGISAGHYAKKHHLKAVFFNDAGIGKNNAGIKSLDYLDDAGIIACTVDCMSAEIFNGQDTFENGIISVCNHQAKTRNIREKMTLKEAINLI
jgi:hypothetical protein